MRRLLSSTAAILALVLSPSAQAQNLNQQGPRQPYIELSAQASASVVNDLGRANAYVELQDSDPAKLAKQVNARVSEALAVTKAYPNVKVRSSGTYTYPVYGKTDRAIETWRMRSEISLESRDIASLSELVGKLQGIAAISQLNVEAAPETYKKAEDEAMVEAIRAFQARAAIAAQALGKRYRIAYLNVGANNPRPYTAQRNVRSLAMSSPAPAPIEVGESTVNITVSGAIELID